MWKYFQILNIFRNSRNHIYCSIDTLSWFVINVSYVIGEKLAKPRKIVIDKGAPQFFYEIVQYWVTYDLVQIIAKYGLMPDFNDNLKEWSSDIYNIARLLRNDTMTNEESKRANVCLDILYDPKQTVHWSNFARCGLATKKHLKGMTSCSLPLVMITWQRMLVEYFHANINETFFEKGNYEPQQRANTRCPLNNLHLSSGKIERVEEMRARSKSNQVFDFSDFTIKRNLSLAYWADKVLQKDPCFDVTKDRIPRRRQPETAGIEKYKISDKTIKWEKEKSDEEDIDETSDGELSEKAVEHNVCEAKELSDQIKYIAEAMNVAKTTIGNIRKKNKTQAKDEVTIQNGCASLLQLTKNELKVDKDMTWNGFMDWIRNDGNYHDKSQDSGNEEKEEEPSEIEILDAENKSTEHLFDSDYFQGDPEDSDESDESNEIEENGVLCGEDGERIPVEADQDGQDLSMDKNGDGKDITNNIENDQNQGMSDSEKQNSEIEQSDERNETYEKNGGGNDGDNKVDSIEDDKGGDIVSDMETAVKDNKRKRNELLDTDTDASSNEESKIVGGKRKGKRGRKKKETEGGGVTSEILVPRRLRKGS